ncbi:MAG: N(G),N(G)-dimethylarginine dimethylaminohydrolase [Acidobacteria bacterium]|nr:MAG: N(G),N(G)-dimethylarginine dimethylaminohydrolase [Acidobacteriota bacterium]
MDKSRLLTRAILRLPSTNFAAGLTTVDLGTPDYAKVLQQHAAYCDALRSLGLTLNVLPADSRYPDSTFVEDAAILTEFCAVITRPGAESRRGEVAELESELAKCFHDVRSIRSPGVLDGGDICEAQDHFFIGLSERTNEAGATQLADILTTQGYTTSLVDVRNIKSILHLKSGLAYVGRNQLVVIDELAECDQFRDYDLIRVTADEQYAANCVRINDAILIAAGYPRFTEQLQSRHLRTVALEMSEFQKMDGGLSCLSLRF